MGLATLFFTEMWERFSFYGTRALLILFMTASVAQGGLGLSAQDAGAIYGLSTAGAYLCALPGGWIADRLLGARSTVFWGGVLIALGNLLLALPGGLAVSGTGLAVIACGTGLLKPNVSVMVGELYDGESASRRDAAFSIFYLGINLGAVLAPLLAGTIGETVGYRWGFLTASIAMVLGLLQYRLTGGWLGATGAPRASEPERRRAARQLLRGIVLAALALLALHTAARIWHLSLTVLASGAGVAMLALAVAYLGGLLSSRGLTRVERRRILVIALFFACAALFWAGYEQAGSTLNLFARDYTDRRFLGHWFAAGEHPASWYQSVPSLFVLLLAPAFAGLWLWLGARRRDPSTPAKMGLGLLQLAAGFVVLMLAARIVVLTGHRVLPGWLILTYLLHTTGELCLSPIGLSSITQLSPARYVGQLMGLWFLGTAIGDLAAGLIGGEVGGGSLTEMPREFLWMALIPAAAGIAMLLFARRAHAWMSDA